MKKLHLILSIFQIIVGICAIIAFVVVATSGEPIGKWVITLVLAILFVAIGTYDIVLYLKERKNTDFTDEE